MFENLCAGDIYISVKICEICLLQNLLISLFQVTFHFDLGMKFDSNTILLTIFFIVSPNLINSLI